MRLDEAIQHCLEKAKVFRDFSHFEKDRYRYINLAEEQVQLAKWLEELKEYKQLEEQGLLLKLPCKVGSTIYQLINSHIYEYKVIGICFDILQNKWMYEVAYEIGLEWFKTMCDFDVFGKSKTVFLTKEEAEKELERLEKKV